jgi:leukotriene-A4 hydrolase
VAIQLQAIKDSIYVMLDTKKLNIQSVTDDSGQALQFKLYNDLRRVSLGIPLYIMFKSVLQAGQTKRIIIKYITQPDANAIQWLSSDMTLGKKYPFMYTQGEAIHARTLLPCQDTPSVKVKVSGKVTVPKPLVALVAGLQTKVEEDDLTRTFYYDVPLPIPTYLIAIAAGALESRQISPRTQVWAEVEMVEKAQKEFADTESYIKTVILINFRWKIILLLMNGLNIIFLYFLQGSLMVEWRTPVLLL